jgi:hypothetical protein
MTRHEYNPLEFLNGVHSLDEAALQSIKSLDEIIDWPSYKRIPDEDLRQSFDAMRTIIFAQREFIRRMTLQGYEILDLLEEKEEVPATHLRRR